jgi:hypothetical protein
MKTAISLIIIFACLAWTVIYFSRIIRNKNQKKSACGFNCSSMTCMFLKEQQKNGECRENEDSGKAG